MNKALRYAPYTVNRKRRPLNYNELTGKQHFIIEDYKYDAAYTCELKNAYVTPYGNVYKGWRLIPESTYSMHTNSNHYLSLLKKILLRRVVKVPGLSIVATHSWYDNYYHFTTECLPRLFSVKEYAAQAQLILHADAPAFVKEYIDLLDFKNVLYLKAEQLALAEKLILPMHTAEGHNHNEQVIREVVSWLKSKINVISSGRASFKNIYVSRRKARYRKLLNEEEVIALVKSYGFTIVYLEDYTVVEQIKMLSQVRNFIAVHGAGTTNIMYMEKGGLVIELIHETHYQPCFYNLANAFDLDTVYIQGAATPNSHDPIHDDFTIDMKKLQYHLENNLR